MKVNPLGNYYTMKVLDYPLFVRLFLLLENRGVIKQPCNITFSIKDLLLSL